MLIQRIKVSNYKTYLDLDLDLTVDEECPIILIGGSNGGGKTTLFEAISGALYGLKIENREHFMELLNQGALGNVKPEIMLQITFVGKVLGIEQKYILKRTYVLNAAGKPLESEMQQSLNRLLVSYKGHIGRVELSDSMENFNIKIFHTRGNEISLNQLNAASKQIFIQVLLKVLRNLGDYNPPVMIDTVMGVLDNESRDALMEEYFPQLAEQTILLCTTSEIRTDSDYIKLEPFISKTYTLHRDVEEQKTTVTDGYFGIELNK